MSDYVIVAFFVVAYKLASMLIGLASMFMGYKLFVSGRDADAGDVIGRFHGASISVRRAAPGSFFTVFGAVIIVASVVREVENVHGDVAPASTLNEEVMDDLASGQRGFLSKVSPSQFDGTASTACDVSADKNYGASEPKSARREIGGNR